MAKQFACSDIGMECDFRAKAKDEASLMQKIQKHAAQAHSMKSVPDDVSRKIKAAITDA